MYKRLFRKEDTIFMFYPRIPLRRKRKKKQRFDALSSQ